MFCNFSSAEKQWIHLLRVLGQLVDQKKYTDNELENLTEKKNVHVVKVILTRFTELNINEEVHLIFTC